MIYALCMNGLILVPRVDLYNSTRDALLDAGFSSDNIILPHEISEKNIGEKLITSLENINVDWNSGKVALIMTYQALMSIFRSDSEKCKELLYPSKFSFLVSFP